MSAVPEPGTTSGALVGAPVGADGRNVARLVQETIDRLQSHWQSLVAPGLLLWFLSAFVTCALQVGTTDIAEYHRYALAALHAPLHSYPHEYPAPALAVFMVPLLFPVAYPWAFAVLTGAVLIALLASFASADGLPFDVKAAKRFLAYFTVGGIMVFTARYDIFAVAAAFWGLRAARQGRWSAAWTWSTIGAALKLFPAVFWPAFLIAEMKVTGRFPLRRLIWVAGAVVLVVGLPALFDPAAVMNVAHYYTHRPTEIGSLASGISMIVAPSSYKVVVSYQSMNNLSPVAGSLSLGISVAAAAGCIAAWRAQVRDRIPLEAVCLATLTLLVLGMKVLSVQYLFWMMPFWALYSYRASWLVASFANTVIYPFSIFNAHYLFLPVHGYQVSLGLIYFARDFLVLGGTALWLRSYLTDAPLDERPRRPRSMLRRMGARAPGPSPVSTP